MEQKQLKEWDGNNAPKFHGISDIFCCNGSYILHYGHNLEWEKAKDLQKYYDVFFSCFYPKFR